jgi:hypothetical protein
MEPIGVQPEGLTDFGRVLCPGVMHPVKTAIGMVLACLALVHVVPLQAWQWGKQR